MTGFIVLTSTVSLGSATDHLKDNISYFGLAIIHI
jgi:hypothetical protein